MGDIGQHQGKKEDPEVRLAFQRHKERERAERADERTGNVDPPAAEAIRKPGEAGDCQTADSADQQANIKEQFTRQAEVLR